MNREAFFAAVRSSLFGGKLTTQQVQGIEAILDEADKVTIDPRWLAYMLATTFHETGQTMQPIRENGGPTYFTRMYDIKGSRPALAKANGNTTPGDGPRYAGRGLVQLTWKNNYARFGKLLNLDLVGNPDLALQPKVAVEIMFTGMGKGLFTGKKLGDYFTPTSSDWVNARRIINGLDRANDIADYGKDFYAAIKAAA